MFNVTLTSKLKCLMNGAGIVVWMLLTLKTPRAIKERVEIHLGLLKSTYAAHSRIFKSYEEMFHPKTSIFALLGPELL